MKKIIIIVIAIAITGSGFVAWKTGATINKISTDVSIFDSIVQNVPIVKKKTLKGENDNRINVALLGMRGATLSGGGLLTDTIIIVSYIPSRHGITMVSIPRDLAINENDVRINKVYYDGEKSGEGGLTAVKHELEKITGQKIHYATRVNFAGFSQIVDALGGISITRETQFVEAMQFHEEKVCDGHNGGVFTKRSGNYDIKKNKKGRIVAQYPLCYNKVEECGGIFIVKSGTSILDGETALCYVRSRVTSSDFDRARRQQEVIDAIQRKALSVGTLADFTKVTSLIDVIGDNLQVDMALWEMQKFFEFYANKGFPDVITQTVLDSSADGFLYTPEGAGKNGAAYILKPRGDNYDKIHEMFRTITE